AGSNSDQPACLDVSRRHHEGRAGGRAYAQGYPTPNDRLQCDRALNAKPELNDIQACPLLADFVAKLFFASERATLIQDGASTRNIDSDLEPGNWRRTQSKSNPSPLPNSLLTGKLTGNFVKIASLMRFCTLTRQQIQKLAAKFPTQQNRELFRRNREF